MIRFFISIACMMILSGCLNFNFGSSSNTNQRTDTKKILLANPLNVYKTTSNVVLKVKTQKTNGKWVEMNTDVLIPSGWYIVSGIGIND